MFVESFEEGGDGTQPGVVCLWVKERVLSGQTADHFKMDE